MLWAVRAVCCVLCHGPHLHSRSSKRMCQAMHTGLWVGDVLSLSFFLSSLCWLFWPNTKTQTAGSTNLKQTVALNCQVLAPQHQARCQDAQTPSCETCTDLATPAVNESNGKAIVNCIKQARHPCCDGLPSCHFCTSTTDL